MLLKTAKLKRIATPEMYFVECLRDEMGRAGMAGRGREPRQMVSSSACLQVSAQEWWHKVARTQLCPEFKKKKVPGAGGSNVNEIQPFGSRQSHETGKVTLRHREL